MDLKYLNGIYQAKVTTLLNSDDYRSLEQLNHFEFLDYLNNIGYGEGSNYNTLENVLLHEAKNNRSELNSLTESYLIGDVMFMKNDLNNIKIVYKASRYNLEIERYDEVSRFEVDALMQYFKYNNTSLIVGDDIKLLKLVKDINETNIKEELQTIEKTINNHYYTKVKGSLEPLAKYIEVKNFINNLNTFLKLNSKEATKDKLNNALLPQEAFDNSDWLELLGKNESLILEKVSLQYYGKLTAAVEKYFDDEDTILLYNTTNELLDEIVRDLSYDHNSIGSIVYYIHFKQQEIDNIRRLYYARSK